MQSSVDIRHVGNRPIVLALPHAGTQIPVDLLVEQAWREVEGRLADRASPVISEAARRADVSVVAGVWHPCVIDLNQAQENRPLLSSFSRSGLCRTHSSRGEALYSPGAEPDDATISDRVARYWRPYHAALQSEIMRLRERHAQVLLIVSHASARLSPYHAELGAADFNFGTHQGQSCHRNIASRLTSQVHSAGHSWVVNGKIADVFCAQHYGLPAQGVHAVEIEIAGRLHGRLGGVSAGSPPSGLLATEASSRFSDATAQSVDLPFELLMHVMEGSVDLVSGSRLL